MAKKLTHAERQQREKYKHRVAKVAKLHKFSFAASKLARSGKLSGAQKAAITRTLNETKQLRRQLAQQRAVFVPVKSDYRRRRSLETGTVVAKSNRGVFVSVNQAQIERGGLGRLRVRVGRGGGVSIAYGKTRVETVPINKIAFARNPSAVIASEFKRRKARSLSVVINGYESRGAVSGGIVDTQTWQQYTNDLLRRIEDDMLKADKRRTRKTVRDHLSEHVAFRFYFGKGASTATMSLREFMERHAPDEGEDFDDISDDE